MRETIFLTFCRWAAGRRRRVKCMKADAMDSRIMLRACLLAFLLAALANADATAASEYKWWHTMIGATKNNQDKMGRGVGIRVGVLDGLANYQHVEFGKRVDAFGFDDGIYDDFDDHGTHVSGIIGAGRNGFGIVGIAPGVRITNVAVFDDFGFVGDDTTTGAGLLKVQHDGGTVANLSYGPAILYDDLLAISLVSNKIVVTQAAGNDGINLPSIVFSQPLKNLIVVGAVDQKKRIASFSNRPGNGCFLRYYRAICRNGDKHMYRFLVAPGKGIVSTAANGKYVGMSGTSMAAPMVAGAAALLQSRWTFLKKDPARTAKILLSTAEDLGKKGVDPVYGRGLLRIDKAMVPYGKTSIAIGKTVDQRVSTAVNYLGLSSPFGTGAGLRKALNGIVVFDSFDRDFRVDPNSLVGTPSTALSLARQVDNRLEMAQRGSLVSMQVTDHLGFTGLVPDQPDGIFGPLASPPTGYFDDTKEGSDPWRFVGDLGSLSFSFGQGTDMTPGIVMGGPEDLFLLNPEAASQPLVALGKQTFFGLGRYKISDSFGLGLGFVMSDAETHALNSAGEGRAYLLQADYTPIKWLGLQVTQTLLSEDNATLGSSSGGALALGSSAETLASGVAMSMNIMPGTTVRFNVTAAITESDAAPGSLFRNVDTLLSRSYGLSLVHKGVFGEDDEIGLSVTKPFRIQSGEASLETPVGRTVAGEVIYGRRTFSLEPEGSQTDIDLGYRATITPELGVGINLFYQGEVNHDPNETSAGLFSSMRLIY